MSDALTLDQVLDWIIRNKVDDPKIYEHLTGPIDQVAVDAVIAKIHEINSMPKPADMSAKSFESHKNKLKGDEFEKLVGVVLRIVKPFSSWNKVASTTNEIDWLVMLGPTAAHHPAMREWGTHFICECKSGEQNVSVTWTGKLNTVLETHGASVGLLISNKGISKKGKASAVRFQIQLLAAKADPKFIICLSLEEVQQSLKDKKFLQLIAQRYIEAKTGTAQLKAIA